MKAILLSGGRGTRLRPLTHSNNKHAIPIANKPLILYPFEDIVDAGIKEIGVVVNETKAEIEEILGNGSKWGAKITYIYQDRPGGLAHALSLCEDFVGKDKFVMVLGDNMLESGIKKFVENFEKNDAKGHLLGIKVPVEEHARLGMATINDKNEVVAYLEKPGVVDKSDKYVPEKSYAVPGFYFADEKIFECFKGKDAIKPSSRGELEIPHAFNWLINHGYRVTLDEAKGWWKDPGKPSDTLLTNRAVLETIIKEKNDGKLENTTIEGGVNIGKGTVIKNSKLRGPLIIGENVVIENAYIGPNTSIYDDCSIKNAEIENSIILGNVKIENVKTRLDSCLIGWDAEVTEVDERPKSSSLFIGDNSIVKL